MDTSPDLYFTTFHGPIVGETWHENPLGDGGGYGDVVIVSMSKRWDSTVVFRIDGAQYPGIGSVQVKDWQRYRYTFGAAPFMRTFTRVP